MVTIGVDAHKTVHHAVALTPDGTILGQWRGATTPTHWKALATWAEQFPGPRQWGIEGAWNYGRGLAQFLVATNEVVYEVNPRWTAERRRRARTGGKSDRLDAIAVAKLVRDEAPALPRVTGEDTSTVLDLLVTEREALLAEATRIRNQLHHLVLQLSPTLATEVPRLTSAAALRKVEQFNLPAATCVQQQRLAARTRLVGRLRLALEQAAALEREICRLAQERYLPLTALNGVQLLTAGALAGILGPGQRFRTEAELAANAGVAPVETSSADVVRHRLSRGGNRRLNAILYRIALTQARSWPPAQAYVAKKQAEGKSWREAIRALKRYLVRAVWRLWQRCLHGVVAPEARAVA